jgi:hypothetical protein
LKETAENPEEDWQSYAEYWENYYRTKRKDDWILYLKCLHEKNGPSAEGKL